MGAGSLWRRVTHRNKAEEAVRGHKVGRPAEKSPLGCWCVSLNKSVKQPSDPAGLATEGSPQRDTDRLGRHKGFSFPGALTVKSNMKGQENLPFSQNT